MTPESVNTPEILAQISEWRAEAAVVVAFGQLLSQKFLDLFPKRVVNVHASLLPRWRGAAPVQRALMAGDSETGVSLQIIVKKMDAGPLLGVRKIPLTLESDAIGVFKSVAELGSDLISVELMDYMRGNLTPTFQDETQVTMAPKIDKSEATVDWTWPAEKIHNLVRGLTAGPGAQSSRGGKIVKLHQTRVGQGGGKVPGQLIATGSGLHVVCGQGVLEIIRIQPESSKVMGAADYLRGHPVKQGDSFGPAQPVSRRA